MKKIDRDSKSDIINSLLRTNFDIKDESLDIDLSVCAAIPDSGSSGIPLWLSDMEETADYFKPSSSESLRVVLNNNNYEIPNEPQSETITGTKKQMSCEEQNHNILTSSFESYENINETNTKFLNKSKSQQELLKIEKKKFRKIVKIEDLNEQGSSLILTPDDIFEKSLMTNFPKPSMERRSTLMNCPECGKSLKIGSMWMHRKIHNKNSKRYICDICDQKFVQKINLTNHLKLHNTEKSYECPECQKSFTERSHMIRHQKYHSDLRPFKCEKCGKMYKTERCLKVHSLVHLDQRPFVCNVCKKSFLSNSKLKQHSNIHTGERPYKCKYCSRDFTNFPNWLKHTRRRHNVDHKTGEVLQIIPPYCSKQRRSKQIKDHTNINEKILIKEIKIEPLEENIKDKRRIFRSIKDATKEEIKSDINDFHSLSLTSAEDLIMEQALELEEAGNLNNNNNQLNLEKRTGYFNPGNHSIFHNLFSTESSSLSSPSSAGGYHQLVIPILPQSSGLQSNNISTNSFYFAANKTQNENNAVTNHILPSMVGAFLGLQKIHSFDI